MKVRIKCIIAVSNKNNRGLLQRELQLANVIIGLLDADSLTCKIISLTNQFNSRHRPASLGQIQPVFIILYVPVLYLITQHLVNKLCNCESTYLERVDDVRDEMINHRLGNYAFGSRLHGEHPLSRATEHQTKNYVGYHNY